MLKYFLPVAIILVCTSGAIGQVIRTEAGLVKKVDGEVLIHCHNRDSGFSGLRDDEALHNDDLVVTGSSGLTVFSLNPGSSLQMSPGTTLRVRETILSAMQFDVNVGEVISSRRRPKKRRITCASCPARNSGNS
jgi:hypothetical protein